ncbi:MAG: hypothetical protein JRF33_15920 [Deltaproteobacteria bacterium]|nr:hypothetical protein [Deltaproteobacteria bacterium]
MLFQRIFGTALILLSLHSPAETQAAQVVLVESSGSNLYRRAMSGFKKSFAGDSITLRAQGVLANPEKLIKAIRKEQPQVIVTVGLGATRTVVSMIDDIPIVFCMANNPRQHGLQRPNTAGVLLEPAPAAQLQAFARLLPKAKRFGIIYDEKASGDFVRAAKRKAKALNIHIDAIRVESRPQVPKALSRLVSRVDALWLLRDAKVMTRSFFKQTILLQYNRKLPVLAYSEQFVRQGALASFAASYSDQGRMVARLVKAILAGKASEVMGIVSPKGHLTINPNAAKQAGLMLPEKLMKRANVIVVEGKEGRP